MTLNKSYPGCVPSDLKGMFMKLKLNTNSSFINISMLFTGLELRIGKN